MPGTLVLIGLNSPRTLEGSLRLGIPDVEVAGTSLQEEEHHVLGRAKPPHSGKLGGKVGRGGRLRLLHGQKMGQPETEQTHGSDPQKFPAGGSIAESAAAAWNH